MEVVTLGINRQNSETQGGEKLVRINKKSDFPLAVRLLRGGKVVSFPDCDFTMEAHVEGSSEIYRAERKGGTCNHCKQDGDRLIIFFDNHNFAEGRLLMELTIEYPDPDYSEDGIRQEHFVETAPIQIVADNGDVLDLRLPEPRIIERVVEKVVEKPVEKVIEKVVEKVIDNSTYTDLQKKAVNWIDNLNVGGILSYPIILNHFLENITDISSLLVSFYGGYMNGANETDPDFNEKIQTAIIQMGFTNPINVSSVLNLFYNINAPNYNLSIGINQGLLKMFNLFAGSTFKTITINHNAGIQMPYSFSSYDLSDIGSKSIDDVIRGIRNDKMFSGTKAEKVTIKISPYSNEQGKDGGWYMLASIGGSIVDTFDVGYEYLGDDNIGIATVVNKILPDVSQDSHKPNLIFRNYAGEVTEELKQKILDKGYLSVEFYKGDTKIL